MQTPEPFQPSDPYYEPEPERPVTPLPRNDGFWTFGDRLTWLAGLVLAISAFTGWYVGSGEGGITLSVIGWHTGTLGILVFFIGLAVLALTAVREAGSGPASRSSRRASSRSRSGRSRRSSC